MMRTGWLIIPAVVLALVAGGAIGAAVGHTDHDRGDRVIQVTAPLAGSDQQPQVITIHDDGGRWRHGLFPFGFLFPLLWIGLIFFMISAFFGRGRRGGPGRWGGGPEQWHRRQHAGDTPQQPGPAAGT